LIISSLSLGVGKFSVGRRIESLQLANRLLTRS
jgi:hypothetical protein